MSVTKLGLKCGKCGKHLNSRCSNMGKCPLKAQNCFFTHYTSKKINNHFLKRLLILYRIVLLFESQSGESFL